MRAVARRADQVGEALPDDDADILVTAAWLHDIGYATALADTGFHPLDGARYLRRRGVSRRICALVAHHSAAAATAERLGLSAAMAEFRDERTPVRDALWYCDSTVGPDGTPMSFDQRMRELRARRGPSDVTVCALDTALTARHAAVTRTEQLLAARITVG